MLAAVLVLTVVPVWVKVGRAVVEHGCFLISQKLLDADDISLTAAHCAKTLILASSSGSPTLRQCVRLLIPGVVEFVAKMAPAIHDGSIIESHAAAVGEVWRAFAALFSITLEEHRRGGVLGFIYLYLHLDNILPSMMEPPSRREPG